MKKVVLGLGAVAIVAVLGALAYMAYAAPNATHLKEDDGMDYIYQMFEKFIEKHNKVYFNTEEHNFRREIYIQRLVEVYEHNQSGQGWFKGINRFSDLTDEEFKRMYLGYRKSFIEDVEELEFDENEEFEASVNWKSKGAVAAVKDQGNCGSCWAFSTVAGVEGAHKIKHGQLLTFSEQQLVDCATSSYGNYGCDGGDLPGSFKYFAKKGAETESAYPYKARDKSCKYSKSDVKTTVSGYNSVKTYSDSALKSGLSKQPLAVCIDASALMSYSSGIISVNACGKRPELDHCVLLYGYDSAWLLKNSWGTSWGEKGYFRFAMGGNTCGIQEEAMTVTVE